MDYFLGVDGGGTRTRSALVDEQGRVVGRGEAGSCNLHHHDEDEVRRHLSEALAASLRGVGVPAEPGIVSAFMGMAGVTRPSTADRYRQLVRQIGLTGARVGIDHDIRIALAGGLGGRAGIALIVGTGSSCYGRDSTGRSWQSGGWGALAADEGSGYDLGRQAIVAAVRMADGRLPATPLRDRVFGWLGVSSVFQMLARVHEEGLERHEVAAFAPEVIRLAQEGDAAARRILEGGATELAAMVKATHRGCPTGDAPEVVIHGGLGVSPTVYRELVSAAILRVLPEARIVEAELEPVLGASLLALQEAGVPITPKVLQSLAEPLVV